MKAKDLFHKKVVNVDHITPENTPMLKVRKKPVVVHAVQLTQPFETTTLEGKICGKVGDYLMYGVRGERYPIDREIFHETYDIVDEDDIVTSPLIPGSVSKSFADAVEKCISQGPIDPNSQLPFPFASKSFADAVEKCVSKGPIEKVLVPVVNNSVLIADEVDELPRPWDDGKGDGLEKIE